MYGLKNLWKFILTALYVFWYTLSWILLLIFGYFAVRITVLLNQKDLTISLEDKMEVDTIREAVTGVIREMTQGTEGMIHLILIESMYWRFVVK